MGYALALAIGMAAKETTILVFGAALLLNWRQWRPYAVAVPVLAVYAYFRNEVSLSTDPSMFDRSIASRVTLYGLIELTQTFLFLWVLAAYGWMKCEVNSFLKRLAPLALAPIAAMLVLGTDIGRILFLNYWLVIPLSLLALRKLVPGQSKTC